MASTEQDAVQEDIQPLTSDKIEFRTLAEDAPVMLWLANTDGVNVFTNSRWRTFVGDSKVNSQGGDAWLDALHPQDRKKCLETFQEAFQNHKPFEMEYRLKRRDGEWRYILDCGEPYIGPNGKFSGFIGSSTDITERKLHEEKLKVSNQEMSQHNKEMNIINMLNSYLQVCRTLDETFPVITHYSSKLFPNCGGVLYLFNENRTVVESAAQWGNFSQPSASVMNPDDCWSLRQGKQHIANATDKMLTCKHLNEKTRNGYTCVPIIAQGDMLGMLHVQFPAIDNLLSEEAQQRKVESRQRLVCVAADNLALSLMSLKLRAALEEQSIRDSLTSLYNRRFMEINLEREVSRSERNKSPLGLMVIDIDHFKRVNDNYGHDIGDSVLKAIGAFLKNQFRNSDIVCRFGGEEFVVILPDCPLEMLAKRAEMTRIGIKDLSINAANLTLDSITTSIGIASIPDHGNDSKSLFKAADYALYDAKKNGRDRVSTANGTAPGEKTAFQSNPDSPEMTRKIA